MLDRMPFFLLRVRLGAPKHRLVRGREVEAGGGEARGRLLPDLLGRGQERVPGRGGNRQMG